MKHPVFIPIILFIRKTPMAYWGLCFMACFAACTQSPVMDEHPEFVQAIYTRADTAQAKYIDETFHFIDAAFNALPNPGIGDVFIKDSIKLSKYYYAKNDYKSFVALLDTMIALTKKYTHEEKYAQRYAQTLYQKGGYCLAMKKYNESLHYIAMADKVVLNLVKNKCSIANYAGVKSYLLFAQEKYLESAASFRTQYQSSQFNCSDDSSRLVLDLQRCLNNVALSYLRAGATDSAAWYQQLALHTIVSNENKYPLHNVEFDCAKAVIYGDQAEVLALKGRYTESEQLYRKSIAGTSTEDIGYTQSTQARLAAVYLTNKKNDAAKRVLNQLKQSLDTLPNEKHLMRWCKLTVGYYSNTNRLATAFRFLQQYNALRDAELERDKKFVDVDVAKEFENLELKYANEVLQEENKLKSVYLLTAALIFMAAAAIALFVWYNLKRTRKLHQQVGQKNKDLQIALSSLEQSHDENSRIIRIVAHDLKSPISAINNLIFSLLRKDYPDELKEILRLIKNACANSMVLINDVLHKKKDPASIRKELVNMKRLIEYCVDLLQTKASEKNQQLTLDAEDAMLMLNRQKMWRVISNIINNAIKFSPENAVINIKLKKKVSSILISVHDRGIGIPADLKDKIFSLSPEVSRLGTFGEESHGLGLSISRKLVEEHEGKIWFENNDEKGAIFFIELPCEN